MPKKWGLAVDLDRCTGCGACVTACHAENNIPTVGPEQAGRGRAMHWLRVERYWEGDFPDEGLNAQVYNRCIGTRYCANACPYNVRFFDFFHPQWPKPLHLQLNPDVSIREVGVMEKCTFCIQRISAAQIEAKANTREVADGEIKPACVQGCASRALVFGDLNDPESEVARLARQARGSKLLADLGTLPNVTYLGRQSQA
jgi:Fe-S-cluster-containing dehydrogenase component